MTLKKMLLEVQALRNMRMANDNTGNITPFIVMTGNCIYLDVYELVVSLVGKDGIKPCYRWEENTDTVDVWDSLKFRIELNGRTSFRQAWRALRQCVKNIQRRRSSHGVAVACAMLLRTDVSFLFQQDTYLSKVGVEVVV